MNFLAHIYLSGEDEDLMVGNFIADFVKGKKKDDFPDRIKKGIELHRAIDDFTDHHPITSESKKRLYPKHHKYAPVIVDLFYDHFLAKNFSDYSNKPLLQFVDDTYNTLLKFSEILPLSVQKILPFMIEKNWLFNYSTVEGIGRSLSGLSKRVAFENKMDDSIIDLTLYYSEFEKEFTLFFPQLINFTASKS